MGYIVQVTEEQVIWRWDASDTNQPPNPVCLLDSGCNLPCCGIFGRQRNGAVGKPFCTVADVDLYAAFPEVVC